MRFFIFIPPRYTVIFFFRIPHRFHIIFVTVTPIKIYYNGLYKIIINSN